MERHASAGEAGMPGGACCPGSRQERRPLTGEDPAESPGRTAWWSVPLHRKIAYFRAPGRVCSACPWLQVSRHVTSGREGTVALMDRGGRETGSVTSSGRPSVFAGFRFPREVISVAVRWYLRYGLSYRDVEELLAERGITVDHVTV